MLRPMSETARIVLGLVLVSCAAAPAPAPASLDEPASVPQVVAAARLPVALPDFFAEGLAWDPTNDRLLLGGIVDQSIVAVAPDGTSPRRFAATPGAWSVFGIVVDPTRALVWAACSAVPQGRTVPTELGRAGVFAFALADGAPRYERITAAGDGVAHLFGDLALGDDGTVFVTDTGGGGVFAATADDPTLRTVVPGGSFRSVQGIAIVDATTVVVADYSTGLVRVGLGADGVVAVEAIERPADVDLRGIDGLARRGSTLAAVQNGASPPRLLRVDLSADARRVEAAAVFHVPESADGEPTLATFVGDELWVTQTDRWDRVFDQAGRPRPAVAIDPPVVLRLRW